MQKQKTLLQDTSSYLKEMGISHWLLIHPEKLTGYKPTKITLRNSCKLLLVSTSCPALEEAKLFERVLKSIQLNLSQARHLIPEYLNYLAKHQLEWIWFADTKMIKGIAEKSLSSPSLSKLNNNRGERRALWKQICHFKNL
ncbi:DNA polymerase III subunit psi [Candidatus Photodesmus blepharus]|uniref:DNA polymerase III subunit psi n=1 Tax=Candidatus Photodesmus blepharonis TaxID=1179155 RepID=A0A084CMJ1_9GAMM|nr:DNA polymerase III subunit psi [Candidatus Photodesmus blepharus]KEY91020.1 DNA polymerase III subunit psi [Candidatus Photodesmus blepharus]